ncbi:MAG: hypothetical protein ACKVVP_01170 [Chloroflexota bacterium]
MSEVIPVAALTAARPHWWQDPYAVLLRTAIVIGWLPGFTLGLLLMLELAVLRQAGMGWWPHAQTHAHAQIYGFVGLFFFGVATQILPRFLSQPLVGRGWLSLGALLLGASLLGRLSIQPFGASALRNGLLIAVAWTGLVGAALIVGVFARTAVLSARPPERWQALLLLGFISWLGGALASFWGTMSLAQGQMLVAQPVNELVLFLGLWGFATPATMAVGIRVFPNFLLLQSPRDRAQVISIGIYAAGVAVMSSSWLIQVASIEALAICQLLRFIGWLLLAGGGSGFLWSLRVFESPARESVSPHITLPTRLWFRIAYGYLFAALMLGMVFAAREWLGGPPASSTEMSAQRHTLAMGYLMPLIIGMAGRILPEFSGEMTRHPRVLASLVWLWIVGAALRVGGELWSGYTGPGMVFMTIGATLAFTGFAWFSVRLWLAIGRRRPDAFGT